MFRISKSEEPTHTMITVDGQFSGDCIEAVESLCEQEMATGLPVRLFLRDLTTIDEAGRSLLGRLAARGVCLVAHGVYISRVVEKLTSTKEANS
jgi:hypothetical protein